MLKSQALQYQDAAVSSASGLSSGQQNAAPGRVRRYAVLTALLATAMASGVLAASAAPSKYECRGAHRAEYKATASRCESLSVHAARRGCIAQARAEYRAAKAACADH